MHIQAAYIDFTGLWRVRETRKREKGRESGRDTKKERGHIGSWEGQVVWEIREKVEGKE